MNACVCGHSVEEHDGDERGRTACQGTIALEPSSRRGRGHVARCPCWMYEEDKGDEDE